MEVQQKGKPAIEAGTSYATLLHPYDGDTHTEASHDTSFCNQNHYLSKVASASVDDLQN
jgi:hypothetical protein